jgi:putative ABC transport system permease protein
VVSSLSRTAIAIAALMIAVSVTIGVSLMVSSFRYTVVAWLAQTVQGDVYISPPSATATANTATIDPAAEAIVRGWPGVARVDTLRSVTVDSADGPVQLAAVDNPGLGDERIFLAADGSPEEVWAAMQAGAVIVSEPYANRVGLPRRGGQVTLQTDQGARTFPVAGIYYDYASSQGVVMLALPLYRELWQDPAITALALRLTEGADPDQVTAELQDALAPVQALQVRPNQALRDEALVIFDRTFAITGALQLLATLVAFIGVLSALLSLMLDKQRELGILRAVGLTGRQLWRLVSLETGLMGAVAGLLAMPTGFALALILIYIINRRSFGWTLQMQLAPEPFIQALVVAVVAALLAGIYPAYRMTRMAAADAMRFE